MKLVDTNILIYYFEQNKDYYYKARKILRDIDHPIAISSLTYFEIFLGANEHNKEKLQIALNDFVIIDVNKEIAACAAECMRAKKISKRIKMDTLIAATAIVYNIPLVTNNKKDFLWVEGLELEGI